MPSIIGLSAIAALTISSTVASVASPHSIGSDLSIITHNDLYGNFTTRPSSSIVISTPYKYSIAATKCAAIGTALWNPDSYAQGLDYLQYLDYDKTAGDVGIYWIKANSTTHDCRAITANGSRKQLPCNTKLPALCSNTATDEIRQILVTTNNATVLGRRAESNSAFRFLGIKYASIPARFSHSTYLPPTPGSNISAVEYAPRCIQSSCGAAGQAPCTEDCLTLNIWTPYLPNGKVATSKRKAVMVWVHGGGFTSGTASDTTFDGSALASRGDVVAVTINYRLSTLGFLALENTTISGNYGLQDQSTALDWLRAHIEDFGGDKDRITIFGQSAGAASVRALLASPQARDKVAGAIMMSTPQGLAYATSFAEYYTVAEATNRTGALVSEVGCGRTAGEELIACLRKVDPLTLVGYRNFYPVVSAPFLPTSSLSLTPAAPRIPIPILAGIMHDDGSPFTAYTNTTNLSAILTAQSYPASAILSSGLFPLPQDSNTTAAIFNTTSRIATDAQFRCLAQSTAYTAVQNKIFSEYYTYEFTRSYQISDWSPNPPACEAPPSPIHPLGDPDSPAYYRCHSGELYAVFGTTVSQGSLPRDERDIPFSQYVIDTWTAFARTGTPNAEKGFWESRGFVNSTGFAREAGMWRALGQGEKRVRVLGTEVRDGGFREVEQCEVLGLGLEYYDE
ncbi:alpha/beta-hydrolase [Plenodomus tracheiphilus IPT5]|uniref:Carboxylic ester hydrolase n=1 Tax=Plenodomus tracheiphilus IPT5 TaxID=1408161 RepID=A0A6A7AUR8_9PLEO|nr:alpha/beta-hydrolase [Plenodomus tracheiphilus IPT5]